jgi:hypothetical protein
MQKIIEWFKIHWHKFSFRIFIICALTIVYLDVFHNSAFVDFIQFLFLVAFKDLITSVVHNDAVVTALSVAIVGVVGALFKKNDKK